MKNLILIPLLCVLTAGVLSAQDVTPAPQPSPKKWTVFVYMNADNELEPYAFKDLMEMREARLPDDVNVVILLDRQGIEKSDYYPDWVGGVQFRLGDLVKTSKVTAVPTNMGDGQTLARFLGWGKSNYPAQRYAVILWCHGNGWRPFRIVEDRPAPRNARAGAEKPKQVEVPVGIETHLFKAASSDHGDQLYNREIADALARSFDDRKLDLLAFDSCLMGMVEAAYAFRNVAESYVASEEMVPGYGFDYHAWLDALAAKPEMNGVEAGKAIVKTYGEYYKKAKNQRATLALIDLTKIGAVAEATSVFADALKDALDDHGKTIAATRKTKVWAFDPLTCVTPAGSTKEECKGGIFHHVDLAKFAAAVAEETNDAGVVAAAQRLRTEIRGAVLANWAAPGREGGLFGSKGLAVYFPADAETFLNDPWNDHSYDKPATNRFRPYPVEFVADHRWADFLHAYYTRKVTP